MAKGLNKIQLIGNAGKDPETKYAPSGTAVTRLSLATNERRKVGDDYQDVTEWHNIVLFGKTAEVAEKYVKKGDKVYIEGRIQTRSWEKDGEKKYMTEVVGNDLILLGGGTAAGAHKSEPTKDDTEPFF